MKELCTKGAEALAGTIASGEGTSTEVVDAHLARIVEVNPDASAPLETLAIVPTGLNCSIAPVPRRIVFRISGDRA